MPVEPADRASGSTTQGLRRLVVAAGVGFSALFVIAGLASGLQIFGDGSIFSYAVAAREAWAFHWHNISGRLFTYVFAYIPAEAYVGLTDDAKGGIAVYGLLFFSAPLLGLLATLASDRTRGRMIFTYACLSTACLCPLVFGAPTEMWMAHAVFWPALAVCLAASANPRGGALMFAAYLALVFTHEGAVVLSLAILLAVFLHGRRDGILTWVIAAWCGAMLIWLIVKTSLRPDDYIAGVLAGHAYMFIDPRNFLQPAFLLLLAALLGYTVAAALLRPRIPTKADTSAAFGCAAVLAAYWLWFDQSLLAEARYNLRTALLVGTPVFGILATVQATQDDRFPIVRAAHAVRTLNPRFLFGAVLLIMLIHAVETAKFVAGWMDYKAAVRALATGSDSDPTLGDPFFVSSERIGAKLNRLAWNSTTPYLSALVAPGLQPSRLVVDPEATYFWLSCATATRSEQTSTAVPSATRHFIRRYSCLHR